MGSVTLTRREVWVLREHVLGRRPLLALAQEKGVTRTRVQQIKNKAISKVVRAFIEDTRGAGGFDDGRVSRVFLTWLWGVQLQKGENSPGTAK